MEKLDKKGQMQRERRGSDLRDELLSLSIGSMRRAQRGSEQSCFLYLLLKIKLKKRRDFVRAR